MLPVSICLRISRLRNSLTAYVIKIYNTKVMTSDNLEYKWDGRQHMLAYTDYTGNAITKNGIFADHEKMLLHRVGAITCDMLFDPLTATMVDYKAYMVGAKFLLHTETYSMEENERGLNIRVQYTLDDGGGHTPIVGEQEITVEYY